ncbi:putative K domain-containing protein [Rosa chinensis]|uniref:Putative K domain-containing protein n=1 Tax=Rosa chinensis TaxID=74649 RepID=A0A2P6Q5Q5_ROSCH|nr:putative K domain-containing protein [Rosa chinensis]
MLEQFIDYGCIFSTLLQFLKNANQIPGLTSHCFILQLKLEVALIILSQLHGNLCFSAVRRNWNHNSHPLDFPFMDKRLLFLQYILQDLAVLVLLLLLRFITQTMQIPLSYAEDIIGVKGRSIEFIRHSSGALLTVQESRGLPDEITVEIKGTSSQVQAAQQLIQEVIATSNKDQIPSSSGRMDTGLRSSYSQLDSISYPSSSVSSLP